MEIIGLKALNNISNYSIRVVENKTDKVDCHASKINTEICSNTTSSSTIGVASS